MKKTTKLITTMVAMVLVAGFMIVGIFAATQATSTITASINWSATAGIMFTLDAQVVNNAAGNGIGASSTPAKITTQSVTNKTTNAQAGSLTQALDCDFYDGTDDGVNNPSPIVFTYTLKNTGTKTFTVKLSKYPLEAEESGDSSANHKPKVVYSGSLGGTTLTSAQKTNLISSTGLSLSSNQTLILIITLSMASATDAITDADLSITGGFDAGVGFQMS